MCAGHALIRCCIPHDVLPAPRLMHLSQFYPSSSFSYLLLFVLTPGQSCSSSTPVGSAKSGSRHSRSRHSTTATPPDSSDPFAPESSNIPQSILKLRYSSQDFRNSRKKHNVHISQQATSGPRAAGDDRPRTGAEVNASMDLTPIMVM